MSNITTHCNFLEEQDSESTTEEKDPYLNCDPYYQRHLQKAPETKHKTNAPEIEEELKTAFELYSKVCVLLFIIFQSLTFLGIELLACCPKLLVNLTKRVSCYLIF